MSYTGLMLKYSNVNNKSAKNDQIKQTRNPKSIHHSSKKTNSTNKSRPSTAELIDNHIEIKDEIEESPRKVRSRPKSSIKKISTKVSQNNSMVLEREDE